jgi:hypothetical protein
VPAAGADRDRAAAPTAGLEPSLCRVLDLRPTPGKPGGCSAQVEPSEIDLKVFTMFGRLDFARCDIGFVFRVDARGGTRMEGVDVASLGFDSACGDIVACRPTIEDPPLPWKGRVVRSDDGALRNVVDVCIDSCMGRFEGRAAFDLFQRPDGWRMRPLRSVVGQSGFQFDGEWWSLAS